LSFFVYDASAIIAKRIAKKPFSGPDRGQSLVFQEFMQMWVGYKLVKVLRIFGLQTTGIREDLQSWSPHLYITCSCTSRTKSKMQRWKKAHKEFWIYSLMKQTTMAISVQYNLVQKVISRK
jgi:hypothetical protein